MKRAYAAVAAAASVAGGAVFYAHYSQRAAWERMHKGVLRDIEREEAEKAAACDNGVCDLAQTRFRDPVTGQVKEARAAGSQPPQTLPER